VAPGEKPKRDEPEYHVYRSGEREEATPEQKPKGRGIADLIVRAGAVAAAIGSIVALVALVWPDSPGKQGAQLSNVSSESDVSLADFTARQQIAALPPRQARGRPAGTLRATGPPGHGVAVLASAEAPPGGAGPTTPDGEGPTTADPNAPSQQPGDEKTAPMETPGSPEAPAGSIETENAMLKRALDDVIPPSYDLDPTCDETESSCSPTPRALKFVLGDEETAVAGTDPVKSARKLLRVLRSTRVRTSSDSGSQEVLGVTVSFELQLDGFKGKRSDVRWSLYGARDKRRVPRDWLINRRALSLQGKADADQASKEFWVPLPRRKGPFFVRVGVYDEKNTRLTYEDTKPFR